jgi:phosphatidylglycerol:prolipoprotein diacylglycerol transferase
MAFRFHEWLSTAWGFTIPIPAYFPVLALGFIVGACVIVYEAQRAGIEAPTALDMFLYVGIGIIIGARLFIVLPHFDYYLAHPREMFHISEAGLASHGGFLVGFALVLAYVAYRGLPFLTVADTLPAGVGLILFFARIGGFLEGSCYGAVTQLPWGVRFPVGSIAYAELLQQRLVASGEQLTPPLHPTQLYAAAAGLCLFALAWWLSRHKRFSGEVFFGSLLFYAGTRLGIDMLRGDFGGEALFFGLLPTTQLITAVLGIIAVLGMVLQTWRFKRTAPAGQLVT